MRTLKYWFEKPYFVWLLVCIGYLSVFFSVTAPTPFNESEQQHYDILKQFSESSFPPKIGLIRNLDNWQGHIGFYGIMGRAFLILKGDPINLRLLSLAIALAAVLIFVKLGYTYVYHNRFNPLWVSIATVLFAVNPYMLETAFQISPMGLFITLLLLAMLLFKKERIVLGAVVLSLATLLDWTALLLAVAVSVARILENESRVLRIERVLALLLPFVVGALPFIAWRGLVPEGDARGMWEAYWHGRPFFRLDALYYSIALLPVYGLYFTWSWGLRARTREQTVGAIVTALSIPIFFLFPAKDETGKVLGLMDELMYQASIQYKNLLLFVPWIFGMFLFVQLILAQTRDRSRSLRFFIVLFFLAQPFVVGSGDREFLAVVPFLLLFTLSESLVGDEGKLA